MATPRPDGTDDTHDASDQETEEERTDRRWNEMLQELRVAQTGVQVLTGFLLTVPFSQRFGGLDTVQRTAYLIVVLGRPASWIAIGITAVVLAGLWLVLPVVGAEVEDG